MRDITVTSQETPSPNRRPQRDTYLGAAAIALAVGCLLGISGWPSCVGLVLVAVAFLGQPDRRRKVLRVAALAFAAALALTYTVQTLQSFGLLGFPFGEGRSALGHALAILSHLLTLIGIALVVWAFSPRNDCGRRNRWLGWGAAAVAAGGVVALAYYAVTPWPSASDIIPFDWARVFDIGDLFFWTLAFGTVAWAFFISVRKPASPAHPRLAAREGFLALACVGLSLSYACTLGGLFALFFRVMSEGLPFVFDYIEVLRLLGGVVDILGFVLAAVAFSRSRRSFRSLDLDGGPPAATAVE